MAVGHIQETMKYTVSVQCRVHACRNGPPALVGYDPLLTLLVGDESKLSNPVTALPTVAVLPLVTTEHWGVVIRLASWCTCAPPWSCGAIHTMDIRCGGNRMTSCKQVVVTAVEVEAHWWTFILDTPPVHSIHSLAYAPASCMNCSKLPGLSQPLWPWALQVGPV